jgi:hypothetical protein
MHGQSHDSNSSYLSIIWALDETSPEPEMELPPQRDFVTLMSSSGKGASSQPTTLNI